MDLQKLKEHAMMEEAIASAELAEEETPTPKTVEEVLEQLTWYQINEGVDEIERGVSYVNLDELRQTLTTQKQAADERLRLILPRVQKFIDKVESGRARSKETYADMLFIRDLIAKHGITNL